MTNRNFGVVILFFGFLIAIASGGFLIRAIVVDFENSQVQVEEKDYTPDIQYDNILDSLYTTEYYIDDTVHQIYITVFPEDGQGSVNFDIINGEQDRTVDYLRDQEDPFANIYMGKNSDDLSLQVNATIEIRGQSARLSKQKSYKIKVTDDNYLWFGFDTINLNKHFTDYTRIRNKLSFDLFKGMSSLHGLETKFVELFVRDLSAGSNEFVSYGLYTFVEQPNRDFLDRSYNDKNGIMYKAEYFEFFEYDGLRLETDPAYDKNDFENHLEVKGNPNHEGLLEMLKDVNDYNIEINELIDKYFDEDNMLTWLAFNILTNNYDSNSRNYIIYSPLNSDKWYFIPWDYDKAWETELYLGKWEKGLANYWGVSLFNRYIKGAGNLEKIEKRVEEVRDYLNESQLERYLDDYSKVALKYLNQTPDNQYNLQDYTTDYNLENANDYLKIYEDMKTLPERNYRYFKEHLEDPMPFYLNVPIVEEDRVRLEWDAAFDFQNDLIEYSVTIAKDPTLEEVVDQVDGLITTTYSLEGLEPGQYYWYVRAYDEKGNWMEAFDVYISDFAYFGVGTFEVE